MNIDTSMSLAHPDPSSQYKKLMYTVTSNAISSENEIEPTWYDDHADYCFRFVALGYSELPKAAPFGVCFRIKVNNPMVIGGIKSFKISMAVYNYPPGKKVAALDNKERTFSAAISNEAWPDELLGAINSFSMARTSVTTIVDSTLKQDLGFDDLSSITNVTFHFDNLNKNHYYFSGEYLYLWIWSNIFDIYRDIYGHKEDTPPSIGFSFLQIYSGNMTIEEVEETYGAVIGTVKTGVNRGKMLYIPRAYDVHDVEIYDLEIEFNNRLIIVGNDVKFKVLHGIGGILTITYSDGETVLATQTWGAGEYTTNEIAYNCPSSWLNDAGSKEITITVTDEYERSVQDVFVISLELLGVTVEKKSVISNEINSFSFINRYDSELTIQYYYNGIPFKSMICSNDTMEFAIDIAEVPIPSDNNDGRFEIVAKVLDVRNRVATAIFDLWRFPEIIEHPVSITVGEGFSSSFSVTAKYGSGFLYQWQESVDDGQTWTNLTSNASKKNPFDFIAAYKQNRNLYRCIVKQDIFPRVYTESNPASLTVIKAPEILQNLSDVITVEGNNIELSILTNEQDLSYRWEYKSRNSSEWSDYITTDETLATISIENVSIDLDKAQFRCIVSNAFAQVISSIANITVVSLPIIQSSPQDISIYEEEEFSFSITVAGNELNYQWEVSKDNGITWNEIKYATNLSYGTISSILMNGNKYRCRVSNLAGTVYSEGATLTVIEDHRIDFPSIISQPISTTVAESTMATFAIEATGTDISYQWQVYKNNQWANILDATNSFYSTLATKVIDGNHYRCVVSNAAGAVYSSEAILTVSTSGYVSTPRILTQPKSVNVDLGELVTFWIRADGGDLSYQWQKLNDNTWYDITGAVSASYSLMARTEIHNTQYRCVVTNTAGSAYSNSAMLSIRAGQEISFYGYHSIIISGKNTYGEWEMYPTSRPHVAPPEVKTAYVDLPGADGGLDYTDLLTGEPRFGYRKGSWEFLLIPQEKWASVYRSLVSFLHGRRHTVILEDDPNFIYTGRLSVNEWQSAAHNSLITIDYILEPFARDISGEEEDARTNEILDAANELLSKQENAGLVIAKVAGGTALVEPAMLFEDGDNIAY